MGKKTRASTRARIRIELQGADSLHFERFTRAEVRRLTFPDGVDRLIRLPHRYWHKYDVVSNAWGLAGDYEASTFAKASDEIHAGHPGFEECLREHLAICIEMGWVVYNENQRGNANENR